MKITLLKNYINKPFLLIIALVCLSLTARAQTTKPTVAATAKPAPAVSKGSMAIIESFFKKYKTSSDSAIDYLFSTNKLFTNQSQVSLLKLKLDSLGFNIGKYTGKELIAQKTAGTSLIIYSYLVKHQNQPVRFIFMFYKPANDWELYRFNYDDGMDLELIESVKINKK